MILRFLRWLHCPAQPYEFWKPQSGWIGGLLIGLLIGLIRAAFHYFP